MANPYQSPFAPDPNYGPGEAGERGTSQFTGTHNGFTAVNGSVMVAEGAVNAPGPTPTKYSPASSTFGNAGFSRGSSLYVAAS